MWDGILGIAPILSFIYKQEFLEGGQGCLQAQIQLVVEHFVYNLNHCMWYKPALFPGARLIPTSSMNLAHTKGGLQAWCKESTERAMSINLALWCTTCIAKLTKSGSRFLPKKLTCKHIQTIKFSITNNISQSVYMYMHLPHSAVLQPAPGCGGGRTGRSLYRQIPRDLRQTSPPVHQSSHRLETEWSARDSSWRKVCC